MKRLILVRHGETEMNVLNALKDIRICGRFDTPLTAKGIDDAKRLSKNKHLKDVDIVITSNISRAYKTARYVFPQHKIIFTQYLKERSLGIFEGKYVDDLKKHPEHSRYFIDKTLISFRHGFVVRAPGGENYSDLLISNKRLFSDLDLTDDKTVAMVSHICRIRTILMYTLGLDMNRTLKLHIPNCTPIILDYDLRKNKFRLSEPSLEVLMK